MRILVATVVGFFVLTGGAYGQRSPTRPGNIYGVVFAFSVDVDGRLKEFRLSRVIDIRSGSTKPVDVEVPEVYIAAARAEFMKRLSEPTIEDGKLVEKFTYFYFDPGQPTRTDAGLLVQDESAGRR